MIKITIRDYLILKIGIFFHKVLMVHFNYHANPTFNVNLYAFINKIFLNNLLIT